MTIPINQQIIGADNNGTPVPAVVSVLYNNMMTTLTKAYPHMQDSWLISIDTGGGVVQVKNSLLSGRMGFIMKIADMDSEGRKLRKYAGELLERYRIARDAGTDMREQMANMEINNIGEAVYDGE